MASDVVAVWSGDESRYTPGVPNRDVTTDDLIDPALLAEAFASGTHTPPATRAKSVKE